jgi:hypothetical protein
MGIEPGERTLDFPTLWLNNKAFLAFFLGDNPEDKLARRAHLGDEPLLVDFISPHAFQSLEIRLRPCENGFACFRIRHRCGTGKTM